MEYEASFSVVRTLDDVKSFSITRHIYLCFDCLKEFQAIFRRLLIERSEG